MGQGRVLTWREPNTFIPRTAAPTLTFRPPLAWASLTPGPRITECDSIWRQGL